MSPTMTAAERGLRCQQCGTDNRNDRRFCAACGAALELSCVACGFANTPGDKFCGGCGKPLSSDAAAEPKSKPAIIRPPISRLADTSERRPVAVLYADLAQFTQLTAGRDPEETQRLLAQYFEAVDGVVLDHGGTVDKHIGDAVMALFGAPVAHGDDALRAAQTAGAIHQRLAALSEEIGESLRAHIGVALGEVLAGHVGSASHATYTVTGEAANLAARLMNAAPPGATWVDGAIADEIADTLPCVAQPGVSLKGMNAIPVFAIAASAIEGRTPEAARPLRRMVGRRAEMAQIAALIEGAMDGQGGALLVRGDPGIGKTTLLRETVRNAEERGFAAIQARVLDFGATRETEVGAALCAGLLAEVAPGPRQQALAGAIAGGALPAELAPFAADLLSLAQNPTDLDLLRSMDEAARERGRARTLGTLLRAAARRRPLLVIVEDVHWAGRAVLGRLAELAAAAGESAAILLLSSRIDGDPIDAGWRALARDALASTIELRPLTETDAAQLAGNLSLESGDFVRRCIERAEGNPLFLEQLLRSRALDQDGKLPPSLHGVVLARLDRLDALDRRAVETAAILGQRFRLADLRTLLNEPGYQATELERRHLIRPEGGELAFAHALIRDGVYAALTKERCNHLHRAAASMFAARDPVLMAEHLDRANDSVAPTAYLRAARAESAAFHVERALALAQRGLQIATSPDDRFDLAMEVGKLHRDLGQGEPALAAYEIAVGQAGDDRRKLLATIGLAACNRLLGRVKDALAQADLALASPALADDALLQAELQHLRGNLHFAAGNLDECRAAHQAALAAADQAQSKEWRIRALGGMGDLGYASGTTETARRYFQECVTLADQEGLLRVATANRCMLADCRLFSLDVAEALRDIEMALACARQIGDRYLEMFSMQCRSFVHLITGHNEEAAASTEQALVLSRALKSDRYTYILLATMAATADVTVSSAQRMQYCQEALELAERTSMAFGGPLVLAITAQCEPDPDKQPVWIKRGEELLARSPLAHNQILFRRHAIDWAIERRQWSEARRFAEQLRAFCAAREPIPYVEFVAERALAISDLAEAPGDPVAVARLRSVRDKARARDLRFAFPVLEDD
ncbi:MAG TPA: adenylate/guanylate cyclase domain-containing protein [Dongiaceae bacterium]|nr:adenylate/guanylate cyclase domain-containing protein [Dongiaceae bacterium]